jgi:hypothetical protein
MVVTSTHHVRARRDASTQQRIARHLVTRADDADGFVRVEKTRTGFRVSAAVTGTHEGRRFRATARTSAPTVGQALRAVARGLGVSQ